MTTTYRLHVVKNNPSIANGSAFVEKTTGLNSGNLVYGYYEGNVFGVENLQRFESKAACAAGRLHDNYPTIAKGYLHERFLTYVGTVTVSGDGKYSVNIENPAAIPPNQEGKIEDAMTTPALSV